MTGDGLYSRAEAAKVLGITVQRVAQLSRKHGINRKWHHYYVLTEADLTVLRVRPDGTIRERREP